MLACLNHNDRRLVAHEAIDGVDAPAEGIAHGELETVLVSLRGPFEERREAGAGETCQIHKVAEGQLEFGHAIADRRIKPGKFGGHAVHGVEILNQRQPSFTNVVKTTPM